MGLIGTVAGTLFGGGRNIVKETAEIFVENAEAASVRAQDLTTAALMQFGAEFAQPRLSRFDSFIEGLNRLPRPMLAFGTLALFVSALVDPVWFASRMQGIALVPEPLWWLMGAVVSFYFGTRLQARGQEFRASVSDSIARVGQVSANLAALKALNQVLGAEDGDRPEAATGENAALADWLAGRDGGGGNA